MIPEEWPTEAVVLQQLEHLLAQPTPSTETTRRRASLRSFIGVTVKPNEGIRWGSRHSRRTAWNRCFKLRGMLQSRVIYVTFVLHFEVSVGFVNFKFLISAVFTEATHHSTLVASGPRQRVSGQGRRERRSVTLRPWGGSLPCGNSEERPLLGPLGPSEGPLFCSLLL